MPWPPAGLCTCAASPTSEAPAPAGLVASQVLGLALTRYVLRLPPVVALQRKQIIERVGPILQSLLA